MISLILDSWYHGKCSRICNFDLGLDILKHDKLLSRCGLPTTRLLSSVSRSQGNNPEHGAVILFCGWVEHQSMFFNSEEVGPTIDKIENALRTVTEWHSRNVIGEIAYGSLLGSYLKYCAVLPSGIKRPVLQDFAHEEIEILSKKLGFE